MSRPVPGPSREFSGWDSPVAITTMEYLGETYAGIITTGAGNLSCLYNLQGPGDQWVYYNGGTSAFFFVFLPQLSKMSQIKEKMQVITLDDK